MYQRISLSLYLKTRFILPIYLFPVSPPNRDLRKKNQKLVLPLLPVSWLLAVIQKAVLDKTTDLRCLVFCVVSSCYKIVSVIEEMCGFFIVTLSQYVA